MRLRPWLSLGRLGPLVWFGLIFLGLISPLACTATSGDSGSPFSLSPGMDLPSLEDDVGGRDPTQATGGSSAAGGASAVGGGSAAGGGKPLRHRDFGSRRDPVRTPMQWDASPYGGFSTVQPWLPLYPDYSLKSTHNYR